MHTKKVVVLGAGFGGLRAAILITKKLKSLGLPKKYEVVLVDRNEHHTYTPLLYEAATTSKETANIAKLHAVTNQSIWSLIENLPIVFFHDEVSVIDATGGDIHFRDGKKLRYDHLVIALGSETNYFNIKGLKENSLTLKTFRDAIRIRDTVWNLAMGGSEKIDIIVGGGGSTGVELAAEFMSWCGELKESFPKCRLRVKIVEAGLTILGGFPPHVIGAVEKRLRAIGAEIVTNGKVVSVEKPNVLLEDGRRVPFDVLIWTGGVKAPDIVTKLPLKAESHGQLVVAGKMECVPQTPDLKLRSKIYGLGDVVCLHDLETGKPIPAVAPAAIEQASVVATNVIEDVKLESGLTKKACHHTYKPWDYPYITPVGGKYAVAKIGSFVIAGFLGWLLKGLVELRYLLSIMPFWRALTVWLKGLKIFIQNDRLG